MAKRVFGKGKTKCVIIISFLILLANRNIYPTKLTTASITIQINDLENHDFTSSETYFEFETFLPVGNYIFATILVVDESLDIKLEILYSNGTLISEMDANGAGAEEKMFFCISTPETRNFRVVRLSGEGGVQFGVMNYYYFAEPEGFQDSMNNSEFAKGYSVGLTGGGFDNFIVFEGGIGTTYNFNLYDSNGFIKQVGFMQNFAVHLGYLKESSYFFTVYRSSAQVIAGPYALAVSPKIHENASWFYTPPQWSSQKYCEAFSFTHNLEKNHKYYYHILGESSEFNFKIMEFSSDINGILDCCSLTEIFNENTTDRELKGTFIVPDTGNYAITLKNLEKDLSSFTYDISQIVYLEMNQPEFKSITTEEPTSIRTIASEFRNWEFMYEIQIPQEEEYLLSTSSSNLDLDVDLELLDNDFSSITESHSPTANESIIKTLTPGTYYLRVSHRAGLGDFSISFSKTETPSSCNNYLSHNNIYEDDFVQLNLDIHDENGISSYSVDLDNDTIGSWNAYEFSQDIQRIIDFGYLNVGTHFYRISVNDTKGHSYTFPSDSTYYTFTVKEITSMFNISGIIPHNSYSDVLTVSIEPWMITKVQQCEFYVEDKLIANTSSQPFIFSLNTFDYIDGEYMLKFSLYDTLGRRTDQNITIFIDNSNPTITLIEPSSPKIYSNDPNQIIVQVYDISMIEWVNVSVTAGNFISLVSSLTEATNGTDTYSFYWNTTGLHLLSPQWMIKVTARDILNHTGTYEVNIEIEFPVKTLPSKKTTYDIWPLIIVFSLLYYNNRRE
ncbi:MAG: hypothetical protein ACTSW1_03180 [Candidatus Hodarchaeales archaeon]